MNKLELVFIPFLGPSHLVSAVNAAKLLLDQSHHLAATIIIIHDPTEDNLSNTYSKKILPSTSTTPRLRFINLPRDNSLIPAQSETFLFSYIDNQIDGIRQIVSGLLNQSDSCLAGLVLDMFCTKFIDVAEEFGIPSYVFLATGACSLGLAYDLISLKFEHNQDLRQYDDSDVELSIQCFTKPLPAKVLPPAFVQDGPLGIKFLDYFRRIFDTNGVMINTSYEIEAYAIESLLSSKYIIPKVYPVGPILDVNRDDSVGNEVINWLDTQAENSVVFLCFGTMGRFDEIQVREFANALENCGSKFLWSLRKPWNEGMIQSPVDYDSFEEVLPEGFLERTEGVGKVIGWAPQGAVLAHAAVGGFVSHCGWNSVLESIWFGVPVVTLPMYAEQQMNAFLLVRELGIAEAIRVDYRMEGKAEVVPAEEIQAAIQQVMAEEGGCGGVRLRVKEMQRKSREALEKGGSSYKAQIAFVEDVKRNVSAVAKRPTSNHTVKTVVGNVL